MKEIVAAIQGNKVYSKLKYESGVHRVQRVPGHRAAGPHSHFRRHGRRAARSGRNRHQDRGQGFAHRHVLLLWPRRPVREHDVFRRAHHAHSQRPGRFAAGRKIADQESRQGHARAARAPVRNGAGKAAPAIAAERRGQIKTGDRSEKIRTYNFPQNRVTDHRIGLTLHQLTDVMDGKLGPLVDALVTHYEAERLKQELVEA